MATELGETMYSGDALPAAKTAVLLVIGEPVSNGHKDLILGEISKGFQSWDIDGTGVDINEELASIANGASAGEEGPEGERVIRRSSDEVQVEILVNPQTSTVKMGLKAFLTTSTQHKHLIYAGHGFQGSGAWVLQDDVFTFTKFVQVFRDPDVENALKQQQGGTLSVHCFADGEWSNSNFARQEFGKILKVSVNPEGKLSDMTGVLRFVSYVSNFVEGRSLSKLLQASDVVGNIRFSKPTLYVFPGCQGDSALFGISGFNLLINGGYNRKACFWDFTRHLDRIDAMLLTHLGPDNLFGIGSVLERKAVENVHPEIGYVYLNAGEKTKHSPNGDLAPEDGGLLKASTLKINLAEECSRLIEYCKQIGQAPHPCTRSAKGDTLEPINLYHKVGHGSLDMYVLNPIQDSKEIKEYFQQFSKHVGQFGLSQGLPLQDVLSTCALLVWKPSNPKENITRILFPGNAPQNKVIEGLEKVKNLDFLKHAKCCDKDLHAKPGKKGSLASKAAKPSSAKPASVSSPRDSLRKEKLEKTERPKVASNLKANKGVKEDTNKKAVKEKKEKQKPVKSSTTNGTSVSSSTPSGTPGRDVSPPSDVGAIPAMEASLIDVQPSEPLEQTSGGSVLVAEDSKAEAEQDFQNQFGNLEKADAQQLPVDGDLDSPEPLPDPANYQPDTVLMPEKAEETMAMVDEQVAMSKKTMEDLGIYDEDAEFPEDEVPVQQEAAVLNSHEKAEDEEPEENIGAFENDNPEAEEIQPEALPEPIAVPSYYDSQPNEIPHQPSETPFSSGLPPFEDEIKCESQPQQQGEMPFEDIPAQQEMIPKEEEKEELPKEEGNLDVEPSAQTSVEYPDQFTTETPKINDSVTAMDASVVEQVSTEEVCSPEQENKGNMLSDPADDFDRISSQNIETEGDMMPQADVLTEDDTVGQPVKEDEMMPQTEALTEAEPVGEPVKEDEMMLQTGALKEAEIVGEPVKEDEMMPQTEDLAEADTVGEPVKEDEMMPQTEALTEAEIVGEPVKEDEMMPQTGVLTEAEPVGEPVKEDEMMPQTGFLTEAVTVGEPVKEDEMMPQTEALTETDTVGEPIKEDEMMPQTEALTEADTVGEPMKEDETMPQTEALTEADTVGEPMREDEMMPQTEALTEADIVGDPAKEDEMATEEEYLKEDETVREEDENAKEDESLREEDILEEEEVVGFENEYDDREAIEQPQASDLTSAVNGAGETEQFKADPTHDIIDAEDQEIVNRDQLDQDITGPEKQNVVLEDEPVVDDACIRQSDVTEDLDHSESSIPAAFEKDETPTRAELLSSQETHAQDDTALYPDSDEGVDQTIPGDLPKNFQQKEETDSLDGDPDDEKDVDEACVQEGFQEPPQQSFPANGNGAFGGNPFAMDNQQIPDNAAAASPMEQGGMNPFFGIDEPNKQMPVSGENPFAENLDQEAAHQPFNPLKEWGEPMGLPSPMMEDAASNKPAQNSDKTSKPKPTKTVRNGSLKTADAKAAKKTDTKKAMPSKTSSLGDKRSPPASSRTQKLVNGDSKPAKSLVSEKKTTQKTPNSAEKKTTRTTRPATAPARAESKKIAENSESKAKPARRPATATGNKASAPSIKSMPLPALTPFYVDLTYIPAHGDPNYSDVELFRRVRARYYVLSALSPTSQTLNSLMEAKRTWDDSNLEVTVIPTYDNETLRHWMGLHKDELNDLKIDVAPAASRCTIQLQDHETSCSAYRLEF